MHDDQRQRQSREQDFWGHHLPSVEECVAKFHAGPDPNTAAMLEAVEPVSGARVLDFACGAGVVTAWLAARGADVVGLDLSPESVERSQEVLRRLGLRATFVTGVLEEADGLGVFDAIVGRYALHHTDVPQLALVLAQRLRAGGRAAFLETFASNPLMRLSRRFLVGRLGIQRLGTLDEHPLTASDVEALRSGFGSATIRVEQMRFLRIFDRQVLRRRSRRLSSALAALDDALNRVPKTEWLSYQQVLVLEKVLA